MLYWTSCSFTDCSLLSHFSRVVFNGWILALFGKVSNLDSDLDLGNDGLNTHVKSKKNDFVLASVSLLLARDAIVFGQ
jgi:hypothetical protein